MTAWDIPEELLAEYTGVPLDEVKTDDWKKGAYDFLVASFDDFDQEAFLKDANQAQIVAVIEHFDMLTNNDGDGDDGSDQDQAVNY